jgi:hypothetical protein
MKSEAGAGDPDDQSEQPVEVGCLQRTQIPEISFVGSAHGAQFGDHFGSERAQLGKQAIQPTILPGR